MDWSSQNRPVNHRTDGDLPAEGNCGAFNLPNGTVVEVFSTATTLARDIAKIAWGNDTHTGYVYKFELSRDRYAGSR